MWFIFPQLKGLGRSVNADLYGIEGLEEAREYLSDPDLEPRLVEICEALLVHSNMPPETILGPLDAMKLKSSITLFEVASGGLSPFSDVLEAFFHGIRCEKTLSLLKVT